MPHSRPLAICLTPALVPCRDAGLLLLSTQLQMAVFISICWPFFIIGLALLCFFLFLRLDYGFIIRVRGRALLSSFLSPPAPYPSLQH